jgi:hypothetical protein
MAGFNLKAFFDFDGARASRGIAKAKAKLKGLGASAKKVGASMRASMSGAMGGMVAGLGVAAALGAMRDAISQGSRISDVAMGIGLTSERLQELEYSAIIGGGSMENVQKAFVKIGQAATQASAGNKTYLEAFAGFGIAAEDLKSHTPDELFQKVGKAMAGAPKDLEYMNNMMYLFGRQGTALLPMFALDLDEMSQRAHDVGFVLKEEVVNELDRMEDKLQIAKRSLASLAGKAAVGIMDSYNWLDKHVGEGGLGSYIGYRMGGMDSDEAAHQTYNVDRSRIANEKAAELAAYEEKRNAEKHAAKAKAIALQQEELKKEHDALDKQLERAKEQKTQALEAQMSASEKQHLMVQKILSAQKELDLAGAEYTSAKSKYGEGSVGGKQALLRLEEARAALATLKGKEAGAGARGGAPTRTDELMKAGMMRGSLHMATYADDMRARQVTLLTRIAVGLEANGFLVEAGRIRNQIHGI